MANHEPVFIINPKATYGDCITQLNYTLLQIQDTAMTLSLALSEYNDVTILPYTPWLISEAAEQANMLTRHLGDISKEYRDNSTTLEQAQAFDTKETTK